MRTSLSAATLTEPECSHRDVTSESGASALVMERSTDEPNSLLAVGQGWPV